MTRKITYKDALDGIPEVLLGEGDQAGREEGRGGEPVVEPEHQPVDLDRVEGGVAPDLVEEVHPDQSPVHPRSGIDRQ